MNSPLDRAGFASRFGPRALFGMVHLEPLPGSALWGGSMKEVMAAALRDAVAIRDGGASGIVVENFGDRPFGKVAGGVTVAAMTRIIAQIIDEVKLPVGVNVLRNDPAAALAIAAATGAEFIRVNIHVGAMLTDQGVIEGDARETLRLRRELGSFTAIFADWMVKHATPIAPYDQEQGARDLRERGLADADVASGIATGAAADPEKLALLRRILPDTPLLLGSGLTAENASAFSDLIDGAIVGTAIKKNGLDSPVDPIRVEELRRALRTGV